MNTEEKEQILNNIEDAYLYVSKKKLLEDSKNELEKVSEELANIETEIKKIENIQGDIRKITFKPVLRKPPKMSGVNKFLIGLDIYLIFCLLIFGSRMMSNVKTISDFIGVFLTFLVIIGLIWGVYKFYTFRRSKEYEHYNRPAINLANEHVRKAHNEANRLNDYLKILKNSRKQLRACEGSLVQTTIPAATHEFQLVNTNEKHYLVPSLPEYQDNPNYYSILYKVINNGRAKELEDAMTIAENSLRHQEQLDSDIKTRQLIVEGMKYMASVVNTGFDRIDNQLTEVNTVLNNVNSNLQQLESTVKEQAQTINANLNALNVNMDSLGYQLSNLQNAAWNIEANTSK